MEIILCIISKHIPNRIITCNEKDEPWSTHEVKTALNRNYLVYRKGVKRSRNQTERGNVRDVQNSTSKLVKQAKQDYIKNLVIQFQIEHTRQYLYQNYNYINIETYLRFSSC